MFSLFQHRVLRKLSYKELSHLGQKQLLERPELLQENTKMILYFMLEFWKMYCIAMVTVAWVDCDLHGYNWVAFI